LSLTWFRNCSPAWVKLELHNGKTRVADKPYSGIRPPNTSQAKSVRTARDLIAKKEVDEQVAKESAPGTPKKGVSAPLLPD
jgi:hypothetical protein